jgi:choline dehydrogenase-like flavoprotein
MATSRTDAADGDAVVVVGSGAGGGTLANELCQRGVRTVVLEAGPHLTNDDFVNDEWPAFEQMTWLDPRTTSGTWQVARDWPSSPAHMCKLVGGTTCHWAGVCPRFHEHELRARSEYGPVDGASLLDWPITLRQLEPYYERAERRMGVTHRHGMPPLPANNNYKVLANGALRVGYRDVHTGPCATNSVPHDGRPASIQDGFNFQGDKNRSKWSTLVAELPRAAATGRLDLRPLCHVIRITHDARGRADGVLYVDADGVLQRQRARAVCVAGNAIETPRLLLLSASGLFPDGLANSSGQVGRNYLRHVTGSVYATFERPVRMWRGETMAGLVSDEARSDTARGFAGGYYFETLSAGLPLFAMLAQPRGWGRRFTELLDAYERTAGLWLVGEDMPRATNRVTLDPDVLDQNGQPVPHVHYDDHANDLAMQQHAYERGEAIYDAVHALRTVRVPPYPAGHNMGTCRMSERAEDGVVNSFGQAHDVANLFVSDGSQFTSGGAANPTLTIVALAIRQAEYLVDQLRRGSL